MRYNSIKAPLLLSLYSSLVLASANIYIVKKGDVLSQIAQKYIKDRRVYGKGNGGGLSLLLFLNPAIKNSNLIYPGKKIKLPDEKAPSPLPSADLAQGPAPAAEQKAQQVQRPVCTGEEKARPEPKSSANSNQVKKGRRAAIELTPFYGFSVVKCTDLSSGAKITLASSSQYGMDIRYYQNWNTQFRSYLHLGMANLSFAAPSGSDIQLINASHFMSGIGLGGDIKVRRSLRLGLFADYKKEIFLNSISTKKLGIDAISVPELGLRLDWRILHRDPFTLGVTGQYTELFHSSDENYSVSSGHNLGGTVYVKQNVGWSQFKTELSYLYRHQNTEVLDLIQRDLILQVNWFLPFG